MPRAIEATVDTSEYLVCLIDDAQVERARGEQLLEPTFATEQVAPDEENTGAIERALRGRVRFGNADPKQSEQFVAPLTEQGFRRDQKHTRGALGAQLGEH